MNISPVQINTFTNPKKTSAIIAGTALSATIAASAGKKITCNKTDDYTDKNGVRTIKRELPFYMDMIGIFHKKNMDIKIDNQNHTRTLSETNIDGSKIVRIFKSDEKHRPIERTCYKYASNGAIDFVSKYKTTFNDENNTVKTVIQNKDYKNNSETEVITVNNEFQKQVIKTFIPNTDKFKTEILEKSEINGILNSKVIDENGNIKTESLGKKLKDGSFLVKKDFVSLDGTQTKYFYKGNKNNYELHYKIISEDGEVLSSTDRISRQISKDKRYTSLNGHGYTIEKEQNGLKITDLVKKEFKTIKYIDLVREEKDLNEESKNFIDKLPADTLLNLSDRNYKIYVVDKSLGCTFYPDGNIKTSDDIYSLSHELGHGLDYSKEDNDFEKITNSILYRKNYEEEKHNFVSKLSDIEQDYISYFLMDMGGVRGVNAGACEALAESNALLTGIPDERYMVRSHYLQKYFPKTIAAASKLLLRETIYTEAK